MARVVRVVARQGAVWSGRARLDIFLVAGARSMERHLRGMARLASVRTRGGGRWRVRWRAGMAWQCLVAWEHACALWSCSGARDSGTGAADTEVLGVQSLRGWHGKWRGVRAASGTDQGGEARSGARCPRRGGDGRSAVHHLSTGSSWGGTARALPALKERGGSAGDQGVDRGEREGAAPPQ